MNTFTPTHTHTTHTYTLISKYKKDYREVKTRHEMRESRSPVSANNGSSISKKIKFLRFLVQVLERANSVVPKATYLCIFCLVIVVVSFAIFCEQLSVSLPTHTCGYKMLGQQQTAGFHAMQLPTIVSGCLFCCCACACLSLQPAGFKSAVDTAFHCIPLLSSVAASTYAPVSTVTSLTDPLASAAAFSAKYCASKAFARRRASNAPLRLPSFFSCTASILCWSTCWDKLVSLMS